MEAFYAHTHFIIELFIQLLAVISFWVQTVGLSYDHNRCVRNNDRPEYYSCLWGSYPRNHGLEVPLISVGCCRISGPSGPSTPRWACLCSFLPRGRLKLFLNVTRDEGGSFGWGGAIQYWTACFGQSRWQALGVPLVHHILVTMLTGWFLLSPF